MQAFLAGGGGGGGGSFFIPLHKRLLNRNNIPFPLFRLRGKWPINIFETECWQAKQD